MTGLIVDELNMFDHLITALTCEVLPMGVLRAGRRKWLPARYGRRRGGSGGGGGVGEGEREGGREGNKDGEGVEKARGRKVCGEGKEGRQEVEGGGGKWVGKCGG